MMIRPAELAAIRAGHVDLAFRRWTAPRVKGGTRLRTAVGLLEVLSVEQVAPSALRADDARRAGSQSLADLRRALAHHQDRPVFRVTLRYAGPDPREELREQVPDAAGIAELTSWLDRLDRSSSTGPWTRETLALIDARPEVRAPELAASLGRPTAEFKRDVRKLKEKGLTESLAIGYRLSPRGQAVLDSDGVRRERAPRAPGTALPRSIGAPATRALRAEGLRTLEAVVTRDRDELAALHGVGPVALARLDEALAGAGLAWP
ncbi:hypothetical protein [Nocardioides sp.]|uniref:hypothetical protein n=1 Tax=Nocardioides sp. TaxID=35761 RepID=UPI0032192D73